MIVVKSQPSLAVAGEEAMAGRVGMERALA